MQLVSIVLPTYNAAKWVTDTLDTLIGQTYQDTELIVVDDGSDDDTVAVVRELLARRFPNRWQIIELGSNMGPSAARNAGLRAARGAWVQFLDCDDFISSRKLELQMAYCATAPADVSAVYSSWRRCYFDDGQITWEGQTVSPDLVGKAPIMCLAAACRPLHSAGIARRSALNRIGGFDESLRFWECEEINVRLAEAGELKHVQTPEPAYIWRLHRDKVYIGGEEARYRANHVALGWINLVLKVAHGRTLDAMGLPPPDRKHLLDDCTLWARLLYAKDRDAFRVYLDLARRLDPCLVPSHPGYVTTLARHLGYETAEAVARIGRAPRAMVRKTLQHLRLRRANSLFDWG